MAKTKTSLTVESTILTALKLYAAVTDRDMGDILEEGLRAVIPAELIAQAGELRAKHQTSVGQSPAPVAKAEKKPSAKLKAQERPPRVLESVAGKPEGFDAMVWATVDACKEAGEKISYQDLADGLARHGYNTSRENIRQWRSTSKQGISPEAVPAFVALYPELASVGQV